MPILALLIAAAATPHAVPPCRPAQLRLRADDHDGGYAGMSHNGTALLIHNAGRTCRLPSTPAIEMRDARGRVVARGESERSARTFRLAAGRSASIELRWVSNEVFEHNRSAHARSVTVRIGAGSIRAPIDATLVGEAGTPIGFEQMPAQRPESPGAG